jgi:hypothetical protein
MALTAEMGRAAFLPRWIRLSSYRRDTKIFDGCRMEDRSPKEYRGEAIPLAISLVEL